MARSAQARRRIWPATVQVHGRIDMVHIPYRGGAPMTTDLIGGKEQVGFDVMVTALPQVRIGKLARWASSAPKD